LGAGSGGWVSISVLESGQAASSLDASNDPNSAVTDPTYEFKIPMSLFKGVNKIGFSAGVFQQTKRSSCCGLRTDRGLSLERGGELAFSDVAAPEFSTLVDPIVMFVSACLSLLILRKLARPDEPKSDRLSFGQISHPREAGYLAVSFTHFASALSVEKVVAGRRGRLRHLLIRNCEPPRRHCM